MEPIPFLSLVQRSVAQVTQDGRTDWRVSLELVLPVSTWDLWFACTDEEKIPCWLLPVSGDLRIGGHYQLEGNASGKIVQCEGLKSFRISWEYGGVLSFVTVRLSEAGEHSKLVLEHFAPLPPDGWEQFGAGAVGVGWDQSLFALYRYLETREPMDLEANEAWMRSENGKAFFAMSSDAWGKASLAAGMGAEQVQTMVRNTFSAYIDSGD